MLFSLRFFVQGGHWYVSVTVITPGVLGRFVDGDGDGVTTFKKDPRPHPRRLCACVWTTRETRRDNQQ